MYGKKAESVRILEKIKYLLSCNTLESENDIPLIDIINTLYVYNNINFKYLIDKTELFKLTKNSEENNSYIILEIKHPILNVFLSFNIDLKYLNYSVNSNSNYLLGEIYKLILSNDENNPLINAYLKFGETRILEKIFLFKLSKNIYFNSDELTIDFRQKIKEVKNLQKGEKNSIQLKNKMKIF